MITNEERKYINTIVNRLLKSVIEQMKQIPSHNFFGWKEQITKKDDLFFYNKLR